MAAIHVTLPDGSPRDLPEGATAADLAASIGKRLAKDALVAVVDGEERDLSAPLPDGARVEIVTPESDRGLYTIRHSTAHVLAQAVLSLFPGATYAIGPPIEHGFYYDFELPDGATFSQDDLGRIEAKMREIIRANQPFERHQVSAAEGVALFRAHPYKREIIERVDSSEVSGNGAVSYYRNSDTFIDLCRGPHVPSTGRLGHFALQRVAGAYWRGDHTRPMLQRIYGTAWATDKQLKEHLHRLQEAEKRDHRRLAVELDLVSWPEELGPGLAVWHPKGALVRKLMEDYSRARHQDGGYDFVYSPHIAKSVLWETSGHLDFYKDSMYPSMDLDDGVKYYPKPMNCPFHVMIYRSSQRSYRDLPLRFFELGTVYRYELSGAVHGLLRSRGFTQDDAHIFCTLEMVDEELASLLDFVLSVLRAFGFDEFQAKLSTKPTEKFVGEDSLWQMATAGLRQALDRSGLQYTVDEGAGAFYGPKIDIDVLDAIGRSWQLSTLQLDFNLPERFGLEYIGPDGHAHQPVMIHRALFGSVERFFGVLVEHYAGAFPVWLSPVQARVLPVAEAHDPYAQSVIARLRAAGLRADTDAADEPLGKRIRKAKLEKIPYVLVVGESDVAATTVGVNERGAKDPDRDVPLEAFVARVVDDVAKDAMSDPTHSENPADFAKLANNAVRAEGFMARMWSGWRLPYITRSDDVRTRDVPSGMSIFEGIFRSGLPDETSFILWRGETCFALMNAFPYTTGHLMVLPQRAVPDLDGLTDEEYAELWQGVRSAVHALKSAFRPQGINVGLNLGAAGGAGFPDHLHVHCLPRWAGDTNFMTTIAETRVLPETIADSWRKVRAAWPTD